MPYAAGFVKEPPIIGLFCGKWPVKMKHLMGLRHSVTIPDVIWMYYICL